MTVAVTLLLGTVVVALVAPRVLAVAAARGTDPTIVIVGWWLAIAGVLGTAVLGLALMTVPQAAADTPLAHLVRRAWWYAVAGAPDLLPYRVAAWVAPVLIAAVAVRLLWTAVALRWRARRRTGHQLRFLRGLAEAGTSPAGDAVLWLRSDRPAAFSVGGRDGAVVLTDGLQARLADPGVQAVVAHERAHLRGRHHLLIAAAEVLARAFPAVRLLAEAPAALREQVELAADLLGTLLAATPVQAASALQLSLSVLTATALT